MSEFIERKLRSAKVFRIYLLVLFLIMTVSLISIGFIDDSDETVIIPTILSANALWISGVIYLGSYRPFTSTVKWLINNGMENVADDITSESLMLPRSKIYYGQKALFSKKSHVIIPYSEIAWVYVVETTTSFYIVLTYTTEQVKVYTKDGREFFLKCDIDEFKRLLANCIIPNCPNVVIGYGKEQKARYKQLNPQAVEKEKKIRRIWGIVLMSIGVFSLIVALINIENLNIVGTAILILCFLVSGIVLYMFGKKTK